MGKKGFQLVKRCPQMEVVRNCVIIEFVSSFTQENRIMMINPDVDTQQQPKNGSLCTRSELTTPRTPQEQDLVGLFLWGGQKKGLGGRSSCQRSEIASVSQQNPPPGASQCSSNQQNSPYSRPSKSVFHNFQKHLVTTLKMGISINKTNSKNDPTVHLAQRIWRLFQKSNYYSKRILHFLFGVQGHSHPPLEAFAEVASVYPQYEIELAQQYLREEVSRQGKRLLGRSLLSHRRMQRGEEFQSYFQKFLEEIQRGAISRRLPKSAKKQLLDSVHKS